MENSNPEPRKTSKGFHVLEYLAKILDRLWYLFPSKQKNLRLHRPPFKRNEGYARHFLGGSERLGKNANAPGNELVYVIPVYEVFFIDHVICIINAQKVEEGVLFALFPFFLSMPLVEDDSTMTKVFRPQGFL